MTPARPIVTATGLVKHFPVGSRFFGRARSYIAAVDECGFSLGAGETLGVVGESGCGKSTVARMLIHLVKPDRGSIELDGTAISGRSGGDVRRLRRAVQMVFQDSYASLNPRHTASEEESFGLIAGGQ